MQWPCGAKEARDVQSYTWLQRLLEEESKEGSGEGWRVKGKLGVAEPSKDLGFDPEGSGKCPVFSLPSQTWVSNRLLLDVCFLADFSHTVETGKLWAWYTFNTCSLNRWINEWVNTDGQVGALLVASKKFILALLHLELTPVCSWLSLLQLT